MKPDERGALASAEAHELLIMQALDDAYQGGKLEYMHYSPARDATEARLAALSWAALRAGGAND